MIAFKPACGTCAKVKNWRQKIWLMRASLQPTWCCWWLLDLKIFRIYPSDSAKCMVGPLASLRFDGVTPSEKRIVLVDINGKYRFLKKKEMSWNLVYRNYTKPACWVCLLGRVLLSSGDKCNDNYFDFVSCSLSLCQPGVFGCGFISLVLLWPLPTATFVRQ